MGRQFRSVRKGGSGSHSGAGSGTLVAPVFASSSSTAIQIPNYGITDLTTFTAGEYVMDAPDTGVTKTLVWASSSSAAVVIRMSTAQTVKVGNSAATQITFGLSTCDAAVQLVGLNSTRWAVVSATVPTTLTGATYSTGAAMLNIATS